MAERKASYGGVVVLGAPDKAGLKARLDALLAAAPSGDIPTMQAPSAEDLAALERIVIDFESADELINRIERARQAVEAGALADDRWADWKRLESRGVYRGRGAPGKVAFLFSGQGTQYVNMLRELRDVDAVVAQTFAEADEVMIPILGRPLSDLIFIESDDKAALETAEETLRDTRITQPAVLAVDVALYRLLKSYEIEPDLVIGHSLGEYAALVAAGALTFAEALRVVSVRGRAMAEVAQADNGAMAAIMAPLDEVERILTAVEGYAIICNVNSRSQVVIGGETAAIEKAVSAFGGAGYRAVPLAVSHAFHTRIVEGAARPLQVVIRAQQVQPPVLPVVANVTGDLYPTAPGEIVDLLGRQVYSPVQFVRGIETLYACGARVFVEVGPKRVLAAFAEEILAGRSDVLVVYTNHPRRGAVVSFHQAMCALYAVGLG
ncbi:MAG: acyltransferase domain-containing protein [Anaerolineae bacterium]|nr:acyltransferase domain-containing protein [Anaerolineae bacterium]